MAIRSDLQTNHGAAGHRPPDKHIHPGLWKLVAAAAAILALLVVSVELFGPADTSMMRNPEQQSINH